MEKYIFTFIGALCVCYFCIVCWHKLLNKKINYRDYKFYLALLILNICGTFISFAVPQYLKVFCNIIVFFIVNYIFFCRDITKNILVVLYSYLIVFVSEFIFSVIATLIMGDVLSLQNTGIGMLIINVGVPAIAFIFLKFKFVYKIYNYFLKTFENMKKGNLFTYFILIVILITVFLVISYMKLSPILLFVSTTLLSIFYFIMLFRLANARENYKTVTSKYETSLSSLKEYEIIMDKYRVANHENKNQLLTIRNMINKQDKKTANYIDKLVDNKIKDNETIFYKTSKIPEGGLRAIIYSKLCKMEDMKIKYELDIANDVKAGDLIQLEDSTVLNACKVIGVFLDNSIEAVEHLKTKNIIIEIFIMDNSLCIDISNNYKDQIALDKINNKGYTTKEKGHGYGLALVKEIIHEDANLTHESEISKAMFKQRLKIKM